MDFRETFAQELKDFEAHLKEHFAILPRSAAAGLVQLLSAMEYSSLSGGKRFRPLLVLSTLKALGQEPQAGLDFALAVEMVHTYSLIHDDLPVMDNDDLRRGQPTNHKVFGEAMALLAGDALLTEAFAVLSEGFRGQPRLGLELVRILSRAAGARGMVAGQAIDIFPQPGTRPADELRQLHLLKTGALIRAAVEGAACIAEADTDQREFMAQFGEGLGLAFQLADDLQDHGEKGLEPISCVGVLGVEGTKKLLQDTTDLALAALRGAGLEDSLLADLCEFNQSRAHE